MKIDIITKDNIHLVAQLMSSIKPEWWDMDGALMQLEDPRNNIGWVINDNQAHPTGWLLCSEDFYALFLNLECMGYDDQGNFVTDERLLPLLEKAEEYAKDKGYPVLRYMIGTSELSPFVGVNLTEYWQEGLKEITSVNLEKSKDHGFLYQFGFRPTGFIPHCYGEGAHALMLIKTI